MVFEYKKNESDEYVCHHCNFTAKYQSTMHYHLKKHEGALPHPCKHCDARFMQKSLLDLHIRSRHSKTLEKKDMFECPHEGCEYKDLRKGNRLIHFIRTHLTDIVKHLKLPSKDQGCVASCKSCTKSFKSLSQFYYHASNCVTVDENHPEHNNWVSIKN